MSAYEVEARLRLAQLIKEESQAKRMKLQEVARNGDISVATLRRAKNEPESTLTEETLRALEIAFDFVEHDLDRFMTDPGFHPRRNHPRLNPETSSGDDVV